MNVKIRTAKTWIDNLRLAAHPEGGYFSETYRSSSKSDFYGIADRKAGNGQNSIRNLCTSIYFLIERGRPSKLHRLQSDEIWYFHDGCPVHLIVISPSGKLTELYLGLDVSAGERPQVLVPANHWFGAKLRESEDPMADAFGLFGCAMAPGFDFVDFELGNKTKLTTEFPQYEKIIAELT